VGRKSDPEATRLVPIDLVPPREDLDGKEKKFFDEMFEIDRKELEDQQWGDTLPTDPEELEEFRNPQR